jgi:hypothetical protein
MQKPLTHPFFIILLSAFSLLVYTSTFAQNQTGQELDELESTINLAQKAISDFIRNQHQEARVFAEKHASDIALIASGDFSDEALTRIETNLDRDFPNYYGYSVMSEKLEFHPDDFGERVGETCKGDMMAFYDKRTTAIDLGGYNKAVVYEPRIHPHSGYYHYDTVVPWKTKDAHGLFMISYGPKPLVELLNRYPSNGHELIVINREIEGLIEFTQQGSRDVMTRHLFISKEEKSRIYLRRQIPHTRWDIAFLLDGNTR